MQLPSGVSTRTLPSLPTTLPPPNGESAAAAYELFDQGRYLSALATAVKAVQSSGEREAYTLIGRIYEEGLGVGRNQEVAAEWYAQGAELGDPNAQFALGLMYTEGRGVAKNLSRASSAFEAPATPPAPSALLSSGGRSTGRGTGKSGFDLSNLVPDLDLDEAIVLVVVVAIALSVLAASIWLVVGAPTLLAELLVDSALAGGLYRKLRQDDNTSWIETALKKTALAFALVLVVSAIGGGVIQHYAPHAKSVGDVFSGAKTRP